MKLQHLFAVFTRISEPALNEALLEKEVSGVFSDARQVLPDSVFVAIRGTQNDGHQYISQAIRAGAIALVVMDKNLIPLDYVGFVLQVPNTREILDILASRYYLDPGQELFCVGVTGTNGKTSITYMVECILNRANIPTGVVGTIDHHLVDKVWPSAMTTPDPVSLQKRLREFREAGAKAVAIEVSSHALDQHRVDSVPFNAVIFTNLTRDHLDYHPTMDAYFAAKQRLFTDLLWKTSKRPAFAIVNVEDKYGRRLRVADPAIIWTYGSKNADLTYRILQMDFNLTVFALRTPVGEIEVSLPMAGVHNVMNAIAAIAVGLSVGLSLAECAAAMKSFGGVPGRVQTVPHRQNFSVLVDYAHSPDGLENVLSALVNVRAGLKNPRGQIWVVFGCGGDRDKGKRPLMAEVACRYADRVMVTSDNPRTENPQTIVDEILTGVPTDKKSDILIQVDRREALREVFRLARPGDVVLIAGKGHEDYQIIGTEKIPFSDYLISQEILGSV